MFQKHIDAIRAGAVTKTNVIGIRKALNANERRAYGYDTGCTAPNATETEVQTALNLLTERKPRVVDPALHDSGIARLRDRRYAKRWTPGQAAIIASLDRFELVDFRPCDEAARLATFTPVYRAVGASGAAFCFVNVSWQSGGNGPEVV